MNTIQENLKRIRKEKGMTQEELAQKLYVTRQLISKWEQGKSLPNIESVEQLAQILEVSIDDLIDDESIKTMAYSEAIENRKKRIWVWISIVFSLLAIGIGIYALFIIPNPVEEQTVIINMFFLVEEVDEEEGTLTLSNGDVSLTLAALDESQVIRDASGASIPLMDLKVGDNIKVTYNEDTPLQMTMLLIDHMPDTQLFGVVVDPNGTPYEDLDALLQAVYQGADVRFCYDINSGSSSGWNMESELVYEGAFDWIEKTYDLYLDIDPTKASEDIRVGVITQNGVEYIGSVDLNSQTVFELSGEYLDASETTINWTETIHVTYRIHVRFVTTVNTMTVYEYDQFHTMIQETTVTLDDMADFVAQENTIYAYVKTSESSLSGQTLVHVYEIFRGEKLDLDFASANGLVRTETFDLH